MATQNGNTITKSNGTNVTVSSAIDYGQCRAQHLASLARVITDEEFHHYSVSEQRALLFLVEDIASEMEALMLMVYEEGKDAAGSELARY